MNVQSEFTKVTIYLSPSSSETDIEWSWPRCEADEDALTDALDDLVKLRRSAKRKVA